jgi:hypothetical protein
MDNTENIDSPSSLIGVSRAAMMEVGGLALWSIDIDTRLVTGNSHLFTMFGLPDSAGEEVPLQLFIDKIAEADRERVVQEIDECCLVGRDYSIEYRVRTLAGSDRWVSAQGRASGNSGGPSRLFSGILF